MARRPEKPSASPKTPKPPDKTEDSLGAATKMLAEATAALTAALKQEVSDVVPEARGVLVLGLRDAARGLADASASVERHGAKRTRERRQAKVDRTRTELLAGAAKVFGEKGYEGASVGDIAAAAGFTKGALYANFPSKEDLFLELARDLLAEQAAQPCIPGLEGTPPGAEREKAIVTWLEGVEGRAGMPLALEFLSYTLRHPGSRDTFAPYYTRAFEELARQVATTRRAAGVGAGAGGVDAGAGGVDAGVADAGSAGVGAGAGGVDAETAEPVADAGAADAGAGGIADDPARIEPDQSDWEAALVMLSLSNLVPLLAGIVDSPHVSAQAAARIIERLLS